MNICPKCLKPLEQPFPILPGDFLCCLTCGEILLLNDAYAVVRATPEELLGATRTRFSVLIKRKCAVLQKKLSAELPADLTKDKT